MAVIPCENTRKKAEEIEALLGYKQPIGLTLPKMKEEEEEGEENYGQVAEVTNPSFHIFPVVISSSVVVRYNLYQICVFSLVSFAGPRESDGHVRAQDKSNEGVGYASLAGLVIFLLWKRGRASFKFCIGGLSFVSNAISPFFSNFFLFEKARLHLFFL
jgi:hypothetical protein